MFPFFKKKISFSCGHVIVMDSGPVKCEQDNRTEKKTIIAVSIRKISLSHLVRKNHNVVTTKMTQMNGFADMGSNISISERKKTVSKRCQLLWIGTRK